MIEMRYREKIVWLSLILAIGIVFRHATNYDVYGLSGGFFVWLQRWMSVATDLIVPTFFILSGYLFFCNFNYGELGRKWRGRFFSLVLPYIIWNLIAFVYYEAIAMLPFVSNSMNNCMEPFNLYWAVRNAISTDHNVTWFIRHLIVYVYTIPLLFSLFKRAPWSVSLLVIFAIGGVVRCATHNVYVTGGIYFAVGGILGVHCRAAVVRSYTTAIIAWCWIYLGATTVLQTCGLFPSCFVADWIFVIRVTQALAIWVVADELTKLPSPPWWAHLSFAIYVMHSMILESVEKFFLITVGKTYGGAVADFFLAPLISLVIIYLVANTMRKIFPCGWSFMLGGRG